MTDKKAGQEKGACDTCGKEAAGESDTSMVGDAGKWRPERVCRDCSGRNEREYLFALVR